MTPIDFPQSNMVLGKGQDQYLDLPAHFDIDETVVTSCWKLTWAERLKLLWTGKLWFQQLTFGAPLQPQLPRTDNPFA